MKIDFFKGFIALALSALIAYACFCICDYESLRWIVTCGAFVAIGTPLFLALGATADNPRGSVLMRITSWLVALLMIGINLIFAFCEFSTPWYIILNGIVLLLYALVFRGLLKQDNI